ncbi:MAG: gfo/Idh/MocA family oxidoreductase [Candidatus Omnitrophota bacterium]|jgi:predicted dehydrogenase|nr:MAG: gfo/Idh/MocA family oxidoreductase [Candidatus Omnitrophota bacterium]
MELKRRTFLQSTGKGIFSTSGILFTAQHARSAANDRIRHAVIGNGGQGRSHCKAFSRLDDCEVAAVCDVDPERRALAAETLPNSSHVAQYEDFHKILDDHSIDTVSIATPDHWHAPIAIMAILAGKHVYVEKPCCHTICEGKLLVEAAKKYNKCVQHGTQSRSGQGIIDAIKFMREGNLGEVRMAKAINHQLRKPIGRTPDATPPNSVNYDLWLGPAPLRPFSQNRWHYNWHWHWDYGTGDIGNDGIHQIDVARWGLGVGFPKTVTAIGGQLFYDDDHETPDTQVVTYEYDHCYLLYEMRLWTDYKLEGHDNGVVFYADKGVLEVGRNGCEVTFIGQPKKKIGEGSDFGENINNFVQCVKANDPSKLNAPIDEGFISASLCHLGNIGVRVGRKLHFNAEHCEIVNDSEANRFVGREYRAGYELPKI